MQASSGACGAHDLKGQVLDNRNILSKYCGAAAGLVLASVLLLGAVLLFRYGVLEANVLPAECGGSVAEGLQGWCGVKWAIVQTFVHQRLGWVSLIAGVAAVLTRGRLLARLGWFSGLAGLVLYSFDYAAVGAMLSLLVIGRQLAEKGRGEQQADDHPGAGLRV